MIDRYRPPAWCRVGIGGVDRHADLLTAAVLEHLRELLDQRLPGAELVIVDDGAAASSPTDDGAGASSPTLERPFRLDTVDLADAEPHLLVTDAGWRARLLDAAAVLRGVSRRHEVDHHGWRSRVRSTLPLPDTPYEIVEVGAHGPAAEVDHSRRAGPAVLLVDPWGGSAATQVGEARGVPAVIDGTPPGLLVDAYVDALGVHALTRLGPTLALRPEPEATAAADATIDELADQVFARVIERDGPGVARRQLTAWARWSTSLWVAHRNAERRHREALVRSRRPDEGP